MRNQIVTFRNSATASKHASVFTVYLCYEFGVEFAAARILAHFIQWGIAVMFNSRPG
jgi:hypothetical protein